MLSIIVPTLNAAQTLAATLESLSAWDSDAEIIVVDGGSSDNTIAIANSFDTRVVSGPRGRGSQLAEGARLAVGDWLMFLHADTLLSKEWPNTVHALITNHTMTAGYFRFRLNDDSISARRLERNVAWRCRTLGWPFGDQGLVISRRHYEIVGGYKYIPLMEDIDLIRRLGRKNVTNLPADAITSAAKFQREGYWMRSSRNVTCLCLYLIGVPPHWLKRLYG